MAVKPLGVGLIGSGMISVTYLENMIQRFGILNVVGCSDLIEERAKSKAEEFGIKYMTNEEIFSSKEIDIVVNTTYPLSHHLINKQALEAGKHVHCEKMMACGFEEAQDQYNMAKSKNLRLGMAPDTFLGGGLQTARKLIDDGYIGKPLIVHSIVMRNYAAASPTNPDMPSMVLNKGGTIPFDMGGYYIHAMINMFGPIKRVSGSAKADEIKFSHPLNPLYGQKVEYTDDPTTMVAVLEFESGVIGCLTACSQSQFGAVYPGITVYGTEAAIKCPDPNTFGGPVTIVKGGGFGAGGIEIAEHNIPLTHGYTGEERSFGPEPTNQIRRMFASSRRGIGVADMAWAIRNNRPHRCSAEMGLHAIEVVHGAVQAAKTGQYYNMTTTCERPAALPTGFLGPDAEACLDN